MCANDSALWWALLLPLLCATGGTWSLEEGEWCRAWPSRTDAPGQPFRCSLDVRFCCGTCHLSYCCPFRASRLEQGRCPRLAPRQASTTSPPRTSPPTPASDRPEPWPLTQLSLLAVAMPLSCFLVCYCKEKYLHRQRRYQNFLNYMNQEQMPLVDPCRAWLAHINDPPPLPPYSPDLPPCDEEDCPSQGDSPLPSPTASLRYAEGGNPKEGTVPTPLLHRTVAGHGSEPGSVAEALSNQ